MPAKKKVCTETHYLSLFSVNPATYVHSYPLKETQGHKPCVYLAVEKYILDSMIFY